MGASLDLSLLGAYVPAALVLSAFVLIGNPLVVLAIMGVLGYHKRTGFLAGLTVAQISEFSLIFMAMGVSLGHVEGDALGLVTLVGLITITLSTYMITYSHEIYGFMEPALGVFERRQSGAAELAEDLRGDGAEVVLFGLGRFGLSIARNLRRTGHRVLGIDFDPEVVRKARLEGFEVLFGDATDPEFLAHLPLRDARWVVAAIPWDDASLVHGDPRGGFIRALEGLDCRARIAVTAPSQDEPKRLHVAGADLVFLPFRDAAARAAALLAEDPA